LSLTFVSLKVLFNFSEIFCLSFTLSIFFPSLVLSLSHFLAQAFTTMSLFSILRLPLTALPKVLSGIVDAMACFPRVERLMDADEVPGAEGMRGCERKLLIATVSRSPERVLNFL
jgi:hypothetical protein